MPQRILTRNTNIFVTGVTGLIGGEFVRSISQNHRGTISALIRNQKKMSAKQRFHERLRKSDPNASFLDVSCVDVVAGDITLPDLGMERRQNERLQKSVDIIVHSAADTSFVRKKVVHDTNIEGTKHLIDWASRCDQPPLICYISTATNGGKMSNACVHEEDGCQPDNEHHNEYTRSKAIAETMLRESGLPLLIVRPTIVLSENLPDPGFARTILWFVPLLNEFDAVPIDPASRLDIVPISFVTTMIRQLLEKRDRKYDCYHLSAGETDFSMTADLGSFIDKHYKRNKPIQLIAPDDWSIKDYRKHVVTREQRSLFFGLRYYLPFLNMNVVYDNARLHEEFGSLDISPFHQYMGQMLDRIDLETALAEMALP